MKTIISTQIRFLVGTIVMWAIATIIFQSNLVVYGVTSVIRMATYLQGALLLITGVAYPVEMYRLLLDLKTFIVVHKVFKFSPPKLSITITETLKRVEELLERTIPNGGKTDKDVISYLRDQVETAVLMKFPPCGDEFPPEELTHVFHPEHLEMLLSQEKVSPPPEEEIIVPAIPIEDAEIIWEDTFATTHTKPDGSPHLVSAVTIVAKSV